MNIEKIDETTLYVSVVSSIFSFKPVFQMGRY